MFSRRTPATDKKIGIVFARTCDRCHIKTWWEYWTRKATVSVNSFPLWSNTQNHVLCPNCGLGFPLNDGNARQQAKALARLNREYTGRRATSVEQYQTACESNSVWRMYADRPPIGEAAVGERRVGQDGRNYTWAGAPPKYPGWVIFY